MLLEKRITRNASVRGYQGTKPHTFIYLVDKTKRHILVDKTKPHT